MLWLSNGGAAELIITLFSLLTAADCERARLEVRESLLDAQALYHRFGLRELKRLPAYYQDGEGGLRMKAQIIAPLDIGVGN